MSDQKALFETKAITNPVAGSVRNVKKDPSSGGPVTTGKLCVCTGEYTPNPGEFLVKVYLKSMPGNGVSIPYSGYFSWPDQVTPSPLGSNTWSYPEQLPASIVPDSSGFAWNTVRVVYMVYINGTTVPLDPPPTMSLSYKANPVNQCAQVEGGVEVAKDDETVSHIAQFAPIPAVDRDPAEREGEWLLYRSLSASRLDLGTRLMLNGEPLRARTLAVAGANVNWCRELPHVAYVRRAAGEPTVTGTSFLPGAHLGAVIVSQSRADIHSVVESDCRNDPTIVCCVDTDDICVQVNYNSQSFNSRSGSFDLWVRVID